MIALENASISVIIPSRNPSAIFSKVLDSINNQVLLPDEIVIVDSSLDNSVKNMVEAFEGSINIVYKKVKKAYPGKARNIGVEIASGQWIAFLDCMTVPDVTWLNNSLLLASNFHLDVLFGAWKIEAINNYQKFLRAASFGMITNETLPGTIIRKKVFRESGGFIDFVRAGEDIEWRERLRSQGWKYQNALFPVITYHGISNNYIDTIKKYLIYSFHTARVNILHNVKDAYLSLLLILSAIVLPKWNYLITGWDTNPLFVPHVTKIYLIALILLFLSYQFIHYLFFRNMSQSVYSKTLQLILLIFLTLAVLNWNAVIAGWLEDAVLYLPHVTKIYVGAVIFTSILYRGILLPLKREVEASFLFPFRWIRIGLLGLSLDLIKAPGYLLGAVFGIVRRKAN